MATPTFASVDEYIAAQPEPTRSVLERVRATIRKALPGATEGISYQIPVYKLDGRMVVYFAGFAKHWSLYPATPHVLGALGAALDGLVHSKATIRFPLDEALPTRLVTRIAKARAAEVAEKAPRAAKAAAKAKVRAGAGAKKRSSATPRKAARKR